MTVRPRVFLFSLFFIIFISFSAKLPFTLSKTSLEIKEKQHKIRHSCHPKSREKNPRPSNSHWASEIRKSHERTRETPPIRTNVVNPCKDCKHYEGKVVYGRGQENNEKEEENTETVTHETRQDRERRLEQGLAFYSNWVENLEDKGLAAPHDTILPRSYESAMRIAELKKKEAENNPEFQRNYADKNNGFMNNDNSTQPGSKTPGASATTSKHYAQKTAKTFPNSSKHTDGKMYDVNKYVSLVDKPWLVTIPGNINQHELKNVGQGIVNRNNWSQKNLANVQPQHVQRIPAPQYNVHDGEKMVKKNLSPKNYYQEHQNYPYIYEKTNVHPSAREHYVENYNSTPRPNLQRDPYISRRVVQIDKEEKPYETPYRVNSLAQFYNPFLNARNEQNMQLNLPRLDYDDDDVPRRRNTYEEYVDLRAQQTRSPFSPGPSTRRQTGYLNSPPILPNTTSYDPPNSIRHGTLLKEIQCAKKHAKSNKTQNARQFDL